jgi:hypothetical protein
VPQPQPLPYQGYQPTPAPFYAAPVQTVPVYVTPSQPQFAQFDTGKRSQVNEDSLPSMPTWETATSRRVVDDSHHDEMEMGTIDHTDEAKAPMLANQQPTPRGGHVESFQEYHDTLPYQQRIAQNGGDLGAYGQQTSYRNQTPTGIASSRSPQLTPYGSQSPRPGLEHNYDSYGSNGSSTYQNYAPPSQQNYSTSSHGVPSALAPGQSQTPAYPGQTYQPYQSQSQHQPPQGSWRDV